MVALLLTQTPILPAMVLGAAVLDGGHGIECGVNGQGTVLRLAHGCPATSRQRAAVPCHHHSTLLRLIVREASGDPDHRFGFASAASAIEESGPTRDSAVADASPIQATLPTGSTFAVPVAAAPWIGSFLAAVVAHSPPALDRLRTVVIRA